MTSLTGKIKIVFSKSHYIIKLSFIVANSDKLLKSDYY